ECGKGSRERGNSGTGNRGIGNRRTGNCETENHKTGNRRRGSCERGTSHEGQHDNEYETSVEPSTQNIEPNDSYSNYEKEIESVNIQASSSKTASHSSCNLTASRVLDQGRFAMPLMSTYEIIADSEYSTISAMESPVNNQNESSHQLQSTSTVSGLLQMFDSDNSDDDTSYYEENYEKPTKGKKRQKNNDNEDENNNETA
ncbi:17601_t:CDS:2, partial [Cetraspora pellucida]